MRLYLLFTIVILICMRGEAQDINQAPQPSQILRGKQIFQGKETVNGRIDGHSRNLPPQVAKCINCHAPAKGQKIDDQYAPLLNDRWLLQPRVRRGGPAFAYDQASFCKTIRTGTDPEYVILNRTMPRFDLSNEQCQALWAFLTEKRINEKP